jgi:hypothetical protein
MTPKTIWQIADPSDHPRIQGFIDLTQKLLHTFGEEDLWIRLEVFAEASGIPLPVLTKAVLDAPKPRDPSRIDWYAEHP